MTPLAADGDSTVEPGGAVEVVQPVTVDIPIALAPADEATLTAPDAILTLNGTTAIPGLTGVFYVTLSKVAPIQV